jgi:hypothetical protein
VEQTEIAREATARGEVGFGTRFEDVEGAGEEKRELERGAQRRVVGLRWEDGDVEGIVLTVG